MPEERIYGAGGEPGGTAPGASPVGRVGIDPGAEDTPPSTVSLRQGWSIPQPEELPRPTVWPVVLGLGITFLLWGTITSLLVSGVGLVLFVVALIGWIGDIRDEHAREHHQ